MTMPVFTLQSDHMVWCLDSVALADDEASDLRFEFHVAGQATVVLKKENV
jgi:hypothetical protein